MHVNKTPNTINNLEGCVNQAIVRVFPAKGSSKDIIISVSIKSNGCQDFEKWVSDNN